MKRIILSFILTLCVLSLSSCTDPATADASSQTTTGENVFLSEEQSLSSASSEDDRKVKYITVVSMPESSVPLTEYTPEQIIKLFVESLKKGDNETLCSIYSNRRNNLLTEYGRSDIPPQTIYNVAFEPYDLEDYTVDKKPAPNTVYYLLNLQIVDPDIFFAGPVYEDAHATRFLELVQENGIWKIDSFNSSP